MLFNYYYHIEMLQTSQVFLILLPWRSWSQPLNSMTVKKAVHKNNSVSGRPAGWLKKVRLKTFFFIFAKKKKKKKNPITDNIFMEKKVEKKNCGRPTGFNFSHPLYRKQIFFMDSLNQEYAPPSCSVIVIMQIDQQVGST